MSTRPAPVILDEIVGQRGKHASLGRKLRLNRERNWLVAVILDAYAKADAGRALTDLDTIVVDTFDKAGMGDELRAQGRLFAAMPTATRTELFPAHFARLGLDTAYTVADLAADLPDRQAAVLAEPNATDVDVVGIHEGRVSAAGARRPRRSVTQAFGSELLRAVAPDSEHPKAKDAATDPYAIRAIDFHCTDETGVDWLGSDEPYWIFGSVGAGVAVTTRSHVFGDIDSGDDATFTGDEGWIWSQTGGGAPLPDNEIGSLVELWEHDSGDPAKVQAAVGAAFAVAGAVLKISGVAAWIGAVVSGVGAAVTWLLGFLDDDHIADQTFVFTRQTIIDQIGKIGQSFDLTRRFSDGDGDYTLRIRVTHLGPPPPPGQVTVPNVLGLTSASASARITSVGLVPRVTVAPLDAAAPPQGEASDGGDVTGLPPIGPPVRIVVVAQSPAAGTVVTQGSTVRLQVERLDNR